MPQHGHSTRHQHPSKCSQQQQQFKYIAASTQHTKRSTPHGARSNPPKRWRRHEASLPPCSRRMCQGVAESTRESRIALDHLGGQTHEIVDQQRMLPGSLHEHPQDTDTYTTHTNTNTHTNTHTHTHTHMQIVHTRADGPKPEQYDPPCTLPPPTARCYVNAAPPHTYQHELLRERGRLLAAADVRAGDDLHQACTCTVEVDERELVRQRVDALARVLHPKILKILKIQHNVISLNSIRNIITMCGKRGNIQGKHTTTTTFCQKRKRHTGMYRKHTRQPKSPHETGIVGVNGNTEC